ncbi:MAG: ankyrin repeat domain-containing protein [Thiobacillus sp.]|nr:ankyrin repeat domain-containing protein [Thiobacillus sp.]
MSQESKSENSIFLLSNRFGVVLGSSAGIGALSDIFSPIGGWYISATLFALSVALVLLIWFKKDWIANLIDSHESFRAVRNDVLPCKTACYKAPLFWYAFIGMLVFGYATYTTKANADDGGALASNLAPVSAFQSMVGIMRSVEADVGQIRKDTEIIKRQMDVLDKETSDDPQKELAKRGYNFHPFDFFNAALTGKLEEVRLFRKAGMRHLGDATAPCEAFPQILLLGYGGQPDLKPQIWEEVLVATGDDVLNDCDKTSLLGGGALQGLRATQKTQRQLRKSFQYYDGLLEGRWYITQYSMLMLAVWINEPDMVKLFLAHGADPDRGVEAIQYRETHGVDITPLSEAKRLGLTNIVNILTEHGAKDRRTDIHKLVSDA